MLKLNSTLLRDIIIDFNSENILWGLLRLNEYTTQNSLLRKTILRKYKEEISAYKQAITLTKKLIDGLTLKELSVNEQFLIKSLSRNKRKECKNSFKAVNKTEERKSILCERLKKRMR